MSRKPKPIGLFKTCTKCKKFKSTGDFYPKRQPNGTKKPDSWCKACKTEQNNLSVKKNIDRVREYRKRHHLLNQARHNASSKINNIRLKYGIGIDEYNALITAQSGCCKICGFSLVGKRAAHLDHCHITKKIRGILCKKCNTGLGMFQDDPALLTKALEYLLVPPERLETVCKADHTQRTEMRKLP